MEEPGTLGFFVSQDTEDPTRFTTYERFADRSWDLAIFTQAVRAYAHGHAPIASIKGPGFDLLGDHFSLAPTLLHVAKVKMCFIADVL